jgi:serine/threonine-protein kinase
MVEPGEILAGKYRIERVLGAGGMGVVVAAHHIELDERVAIKFLLPQAVKSPEAVARFTREARAAIKIKSHHVARITDVGTLESGAPYMVMEYLEGQDLSAMVRERGALPVAEAVELVIQACDAIAEAHALGIVHRDLKPANLFCVQGADGLPAVKVLDFGISKVTTLDGLDMTRTTAVMGSPFYMSPEQMTSAKSVDARADIWALGVVLYELLAGRPPFQGETLPELSVRIATETPPPLRNYRPDLPGSLESVILRCLEKDREQRYANVAELVSALVEFGPKRLRTSAERISRIIQNAGLSKSAVQLPPSSEMPPPAAGTVAAWGATGAPGERGSRRGLVALLGIGVVVLGAVGAALVLHTSKTAVAAPASATPAAALPSAPSAAAPAVVPVPPSAPEPVASAAPSASAAVHAETPPVAAQVPARHFKPAPGHVPVKHVAKPAAAKPPAAPAHTAKAAPNCNPPYTIGPNGNHVYKPQCL